MKKWNYLKVVGVVSVFIIVLLLLQSLLFSPSSAPQVQQLNQEPQELQDYLAEQQGEIPTSQEFGDVIPSLVIYEVTPFSTDTFEVIETTSDLNEEYNFLVTIKAPGGDTDFQNWLKEVIYPSDSHFELIYLY